MTSAKALVPCLVVACTAPHEPAPIVGIRPAACDPRSGSGSGEIDEQRGPATAVVLPLLMLVDPDCNTSPSYQLDASPTLVWRDGAADQRAPVTAKQRISWGHDGTRCHVAINVEFLNGPVGRRGSIQPCRLEMISEHWASFAAFPVTVESLWIEDVASPFGGELAWRPEPTVGHCDQPVIESDSLTLAIAARLSMPRDAWRRLHATRPPDLAIGATIEVR